MQVNCLDVALDKFLQFYGIVIPIKYLIIPWDIFFHQLHHITKKLWTKSPLSLNP